MVRRPFVAGNWKMHGSRAENAKLIDTLLESLEAPRAEVLICPPFPYLAEIARAVKGSPIQVGAQSVCAEPQGAFRAKCLPPCCGILGARMPSWVTRSAARSTGRTTHW